MTRTPNFFRFFCSLFISVLLFLTYLLDHKCGYCSLLPNLRYKFGWNPAKRFARWINSLIEAKTGDGHITFKEV